MTNRGVAHRVRRSCSLCGMTAANRRLFRIGSNGRYVCVDTKRCEGRQEVNRA